MPGADFKPGTRQPPIRIKQESRDGSDEVYPIAIEKPDDPSQLVFAIEPGTGRLAIGIFKKLENVSIGTTQTAIAHGLGRPPLFVSVLPYASANVWQSAAADNSNIYLTASVAVNADIYVA